MNVIAFRPLRKMCDAGNQSASPYVRLGMKPFLTLITAVLLTLASGCTGGSGGDTPTVADPPAPAEDEVVLVWTETGGCARGGPNCARYEVTAQGGVTTLRSTFGGFEEAATGQIPAATVAEWLEVVSTTDLAELEARLGPGEMTAAFDGVDYVLEAPAAGYVIDSTQFEFAVGEPFFRTARAVVQAATDAAPLEIQFR